MAKMDRRRRGEIVRSIHEILARHTEGLPATDVFAQLRELVGVTDAEAGEYGPGVPRFEKRARFSTIGAVKAGWLVKDKGMWRITDAGREALAKFPDPYDFIQ